MDRNGALVLKEPCEACYLCSGAIDDAVANMTPVALCRLPNRWSPADGEPALAVFNALFQAGIQQILQVPCF